MDFSYSADQLSLRESTIRFAQESLSAETRSNDQAGNFRTDLWRACGEFGLTGLCVPEAFGGSGHDALSTAIALEALGYGCTDGGLTFSVAAHLLTCAVPIWKSGSPEQRDRFLPELAKGTLIGGNAMTESASGSDAFALEATATKADGGFLLRGTKIFATNAPVADLMIVYARTGEPEGLGTGVTAFLLEMDSPGVRRGQAIEKCGLRTSPTGEIGLDDVFVPESSILGGLGQGGSQFQLSMNWERACLFATHVGTLERTLDATVSHARQRTQFGKPIGKHQAVSHRIANLKIDLEAARLLVYRAAWKLDQTWNATLEASVAKCFASEALVAGSQASMAVFGGRGYMTEHDVERIVRDALGGPLYSGTNDIQRNIIARLLGL